MVKGHWLYTVKVRAEAVAAMARVTTEERTFISVWRVMRDGQACERAVSAGLSGRYFAGFCRFVGPLG